MISEDQFTAWLESPVTQAYLARLKEMGEALKEEWIKASWDNGSADELLLTANRSRAGLIEEIASMTLEDINDEPERDSSD